jgi:para-aminobenzoate synthetase component 1
MKTPRPFEHVHLVEELALAMPLASCRRAFARSNAFLLDGAGAPAGKEHLAEFAFFGAEPFLTFRAPRSSRRGPDGRHGARVVLRDATGTIDAEVDDAFGALRGVLAEHAVPPEALVARPMPLLAGAVGYVGYEAGQMLERLPCRPRPSSCGGAGMPDIAFGLHRWVLGRESRTGRAWLSIVGRGVTSREARRDAEATRDDVLRRLRDAERDVGARASARDDDRAPPRELASLLSRDDYIDRVRVAKQHIEQGDAFEICLTRALEAPFDGDPWDLFSVLRRTNPAPFAAILDLPEGAVVSSSPERFVRLDAQRVAESRPIKGTRPRGASPVEDARLAEDLATSPKDRAENAMIVDLVRNDLGKVCRWGSVSVPEAYAVEPYATVHQLVSTVRGELDDESDAIALLAACFPPGSMTGAPKIEAMSILERLEPTERGVYAGALGFIGLDGTMDTSVVIRTIVVKDGRAHVGVGGAVVADSDPAAEHDETTQKAAALARALGTVEGGP